MKTKIIKILINAIVLFICIPFHESAHAWMADKLGDSTAKDNGRISMNPFAHLDPMGALCMLLIGFGWGKPCPVDARNFKKPKFGFALTALAGPLSNFLLAYIAIIIAKIFSFFYMRTNLLILYTISTFIVYFMFVNIGLAVFNLIPIPPLDGSRIISMVLPEKLYFKLMRYENIFFLILMVLMYTHLFDKPISIMENACYISMDFLTKWVDLIFNAINSHLAVKAI